MEDNLFNRIVESTGLPQELISQEFLKKIQEMGFDKSTITLDQIRDALAEYLQEVILGAREEFK
jgi:hypothetical protein